MEMTKKINIRAVQIIRYVTPLREGGSLPAIVEGDDGFLYVLKFRGAGQGVKALVAELLGGEIARTLGLHMPEIVFAEVDPAFGRTEPDEEIQDLLKASAGLNLALHYLSGSMTYDPAVTQVDPATASKIVLLDSLITNVDRTVRNTNMLMWHKELWLIDHGAAFYFHHAWDNWEELSKRPFAQIKDHVLLSQASELEKTKHEILTALLPDRLREIVDLIPDNWLHASAYSHSPAHAREIYFQFIRNRLDILGQLTKEAQHAREISV